MRPAGLPAQPRRVGVTEFVGSLGMIKGLIVAARVEDRRRLEAMLAGYDFAMTSMDDARAALDECRFRYPDFILLADTPGSAEAVAFLQRLRRQCGRRAPVVILFGDRDDPVEIGRAIWEGASEWLMTPFDDHILDLKLRQAGLV